MFYIAILMLFFSNGDIKVGAYPDALPTLDACNAALAEGGKALQADPPKGAVSASGKCVMESDPTTEKSAEAAP